MTQAEFNQLKTEWLKSEAWRISGYDMDLRTWMTMKGKTLTDEEFSTMVNNSNTK